MSHDRQELTRGLEARQSLVSTWLAAKVGAGVRHFESARRGLRTATARVLQDALARARAAADEVERDMERDFGAAPPRPGIGREELQAVRRHIRLTSALVPHLSNLDDPAWRPAHEAYERSWDELLRALGGAAPALVERR